jgi:hypothetical protein
MSDHLALICGFNRQIMSHKRSERTYQQRAAWHKATPHNIQEYQCRLDNLLLTLTVPHDAVSCEDFNCPIDSSHRQNLDLFISDIVHCCIEAEAWSIPGTAKKQSANIPGWNNFVQDTMPKHYIGTGYGKMQEGPKQVTLLTR